MRLLIDVGGGRGRYLATIHARHPHLGGFRPNARHRQRARNPRRSRRRRSLRTGPRENLRRDIGDQPTARATHHRLAGRPAQRGVPHGLPPRDSADFRPPSSARSHPSSTSAGASARRRSMRRCLRAAGCDLRGPSLSEMLRRRCRTISSRRNRSGRSILQDHALLLGAAPGEEHHLDVALGGKIRRGPCELRVKRDRSPA